jgi:hypothetical protein
VKLILLVFMLQLIIKKSKGVSISTNTVSKYLDAFLFHTHSCGMGIKGVNLIKVTYL